MKLLVSLIAIAAGGICTLMFLRKKPALAKILIPAKLRPTQKKIRSGRLQHPKPQAVHHKRNGMKTHAAN